MKNFFKHTMLQSSIFAVMLVTTTQVALPSTISSAMSLDSQSVLSMSTRADRALNEQRAGAWMNRADVQAQLVARGVNVQEAQARIAALSDRDLARVNARIDSMPAGSSVLLIVGVVFIVLLILELVGVTDIFKSV